MFGKYVPQTPLTPSREDNDASLTSAAEVIRDRCPIDISYQLPA